MKSSTSYLAKFCSYLISLTLFILYISLAACAPHFRSIMDTTERFYRPGFSILAPQENGWNVNEKLRRKIVFFRKGSAPTKSYVLEVSSSVHSFVFESGEEFKLVMGKVVVAASVIPKRNEVVEEKITLEPTMGKFCLKSYIKMKDYAANNKGSEPYLLMTDYGITCLHPDDKSQLVNLKYSYRYPRDANIEEFKAKVNKIIAGLQFEPLLKFKSY